MTKKKIEKIRDDLYVKKGKLGTYEVVYPLKDKEGKLDKKNLKKLIYVDIIATIPTLIVAIALIVMFFPGANEVKVWCEQSIESLQNELEQNSCRYCQAKIRGVVPNINIILPPKDFNFTEDG